MGFDSIGEYAIVGNDDRCALINREGSIDWCCFPHTAGPSVFARILDDETGGHFAVRPTDIHDTDRRYLDGTNVLETTFETQSGRAVLTDFMPVDRTDRRRRLQHAVYRRVHCEDGPITLELEFKPRFDYARAETVVERSDRSIVAKGTDERLHLQIHGEFDARVKPDRAVGTTTITAGETIWFGLQYGLFTPMPPTKCRSSLSRTIRYWQAWSDEIAESTSPLVDGEPWEDAVLRSALTLKLLINEGTGAIYAAATTSLPEEYGTRRNWDYRYNWIRDAKFTVQALHNLGRKEEAREYFDWFREISHEDPSEIQPVYGVHGGTDLVEYELDHLSGHRYSTPVRIGNTVTDQFQLDIYGAIVQGIYETLRHDEQITREDWESIRALVDHVCTVWDRRDAGIWEFRDEPRHYVHSKLLCWVALDRGIELAERHDREAPIDRWRDERSEIREAILERGYSESAESFVQHFETDDVLDATCLLIPVYEFLPADDPRVQQTIDTVLDQLTTESGLVYRTGTSDGVHEERGSFAFCTFWLVDALVLAGRVDEAREIFTTVLNCTTQLGLLSERIDPTTGELLGNFPQAFSHIGLVNSAIYLASTNDETGELKHDPQARGVDVEPLFRKGTEE